MRPIETALVYQHLSATRYSSRRNSSGRTRQMNWIPDFVLIVLHTYNQYASWTVALIHHFVPTATR
jgi:hypothetical protein